MRTCKSFCIILLVVFGSLGEISAQIAEFRLARVKYAGGGDWYNDPSAEVNLLKFLKNNTNLPVKAEYVFADLSTDEIFQYPILFLTGHGNIVFSPQEAKRLRAYLDKGGFLYIDDDYGLDKAVRREMKKVFPEQEFSELPFTHGIYTCLFDFKQGPPKTHKHDEKPARGYGLFSGERLVVYYTVESNPSDGWTDGKVHNNPEEKRNEALKFGANIILWALTN